MFTTSENYHIKTS